MNLRQRYPGLKPFEVGDKTLFFGRDREKQAFFHLITVERVVVIFSKSGMGKTSLINAGITPLLANSELAPVYVRFNNTTLSLREQFLQKLDAAGLVPDDRYADKTLWEQFKFLRPEKQGRAVEPLLVFDQFEELFTLYSQEKREAFVRELAYIANQKIPEPVQADLMRLLREHPGTPDEALAELERQPRARLIFSIRSDLLHLLDELSRFIPGILSTRFELKPLSIEAAREAIVNPAAAPGDFAGPPFTYDPAVLEEILDDLSDQRQIEIEPFQLQIICNKIEKNLIKSPAGTPTVTSESYGGKAGLQNLLVDFYDENIQALPAEWQTVARTIIEDQLITENERRRSVDADDLIAIGAPTELLDTLVEARLLRREPRLGTFYIEISHDTLVPPILVKRKERREQDEKTEALLKAKEAEEKAREAEKAARQESAAFDYARRMAEDAREQYIRLGKERAGTGEKYFMNANDGMTDRLMMVLLNTLYRGQVILFTGENLYATNLKSFVAAQLKERGVDRFSYDEYDGLFTFHEAISSYMIKFELKKAVENVWLDAELSTMLLNIPFSSIITSNIDDGFNKILNNAGIEYNSHYYSIKPRSIPFDINIDPHKINIYHIFGKSDDLESLVLTYQQLFRYVTGFPESEIANYIKKRLMDCKMIVLAGYPLEKWFWKLIFYLLMDVDYRKEILVLYVTDFIPMEHEIFALKDQFGEIRFIHGVRPFFQKLHEMCAQNGILRNLYGPK